MNSDEVYYLDEKDEVILAKDVVPSPRGLGRRADEELIESFRSLKEWEALRLGRTFGKVEREDRNKVSHIIRRHWAMARDDSPRIDFAPDGTPQVRVRE